MHLGRIRRSPGEPVELAAWDSELGLVSLRRPASGIGADPLALLERYGQDGAADLIRTAGAEARPEDLLAEKSVIFEPPVARCSKVCCMALNYRAHAEESGLEVPPDPVLFFKPPSALTGHLGEIRPPARTKHVEHEVELAVVIGTRCRNVPAGEWRSVVAGYTIVNDLTARDLQLINHERNVPWDQSKGFDGFAPLGPYLVTADAVPDPGRLEMTLTIDGQIRQQASTSQMVFDIPQLIEDLTDGMTLEPGDVIATGTTAGIAPVADGDVMHAAITGLGTLSNRVNFADPV
ncbi:fumarylacetoacetate hydrolase family protein [Phytoactinopolyspora endophytica]|uniref:fumarylacetoacetate hydrolase family protein n=1 Tax=Phytoactinopolyspora endophytica TaxID=1642495 RepID=UPI00197C198A|nr:fumarylacetoacetate hydrolase family protein [Phytoactinopolyspora endophytica]